MKNYLYLAAFVSIVLLLASCEKEDPAQLSFEDIYGRPGWEVEEDNSFPKGYFFIKKRTDIEVEEVENSPTTGFTYKISTTGANSSFTTQRLTGGTKNMVLSFKYKASDNVTMSVSLDVLNADASTNIYPLAKSSEWVDYSFDLGLLAPRSGWGGVGSYIKLSFGEQPSKEINIKELCVRERTQEEKDKTERIYLSFPAGSNQLAEFVDMTEYTTYGANYYRYVTSSESDPSVTCKKREQVITQDYNKLTFEYKCENAIKVQVFYKIAGGGNTKEYPVAASTEWKEVTIDMSSDTPAIFKTYADAGQPGPMRFDINGSAGKPLYFRGMYLHK